MTRDKNDVYGEVFTILSLFNDELIDKIPSSVLIKIGNLSLGSKYNFYIDKNKSLKDQNISEDSKDLLALIYYNYIASEDERKEFLNLWNTNEKIYQEQLKKENNFDNLFKNNRKNFSISNTPATSKVAMVEYKKETFFSKIKNFIRKILN